jgi:hypothetical protein
MVISLVVAQSNARFAAAAVLACIDQVAITAFFSGG